MHRVVLLLGLLLLLLLLLFLILLLSQSLLEHLYWCLTTPQFPQSIYCNAIFHPRSSTDQTSFRETSGCSCHPPSGHADKRIHGHADKRTYMRTDRLTCSRHSRPEFAHDISKKFGLGPEILDTAKSGLLSPVNNKQQQPHGRDLFLLLSIA